MELFFSNTDIGHYISGFSNGSTTPLLGPQALKGLQPNCHISPPIHSLAHAQSVWLGATLTLDLALALTLNLAKP